MVPLRRSPLLALAAALLGVAALPCPAGAHGGVDHAERLVDGQLVEVEAAAPAAARAERRVERGWRGTGPRPVAIVQLLMPGTTATPYTATQLREAFVTGAGSASKALTEISGGTVSLTGIRSVEGDVTPNVTVGTGGTCNWSGWADEAQAQLAAQGFDLTPYLQDGNVIYVMRGTTGCSWGGLAWMPGNEVWLNGSLSRKLAVHELGHNLGLDHAATLACTTGGGARAFLTSTCGSPDEYGDPFDPMGNGDRHFSAPHKAQAGWLPSGAVRTVTANGTFALGAASDPAAGTRLLRIPRPDGRSLTVELRRPFGFDAFGTLDWAVRGVLLRLWDPRTITRSLLLDAQPGTSTFTDASLPVGGTVTDVPGSVSVTLNALAGGVATVSVDLRGQGADVTPPAAPTPAAAVATDGTVTLSWPAAADDVATTGYRVARDGVLLGTPATPGFTDAGLALGTSRTYVVTAVDAAGNAAASAPLTVTGAPPVVPVVPSGGTTSGGTTSGTTTTTAPPPADAPAPAAPPADAAPPAATPPATSTMTTPAATKVVSRRKKVRRCTVVKRRGKVVRRKGKAVRRCRTVTIVVRTRVPA